MFRCTGRPRAPERSLVDTGCYLLKDRRRKWLVPTGIGDDASTVTPPISTPMPSLSDQSCLMSGAIGAHSLSS